MTDYYPFGSVASQWKKPQEKDYRFGYQGQFAEEYKETGFNHFEARDYDAVIGRWMAKDPARQYASPYVGMGNNAVNKVDPDGRCDECPTDPNVTFWTNPTDPNFTSYTRGSDGSWVRDTGLMGGEAFVTASAMSYQESRLYDARGFGETYSAWIGTDPMNLRKGTVPPTLKAIVGIIPLVQLTDSYYVIFHDRSYDGIPATSTHDKLMAGIGAFTSFYGGSNVGYSLLNKIGPVAPTVGKIVDGVMQVNGALHDLEAHNFEYGPKGDQ